MDKKILQLAQLIRGARGCVFFGGAGASTESGIPDFRGAEGIYWGEHPIPPETILSHSFFTAEPGLFFSYYRQHLLFPQARPNQAHISLAKWEQRGLLQAVITQNIDGLHQAAGSKTVHELHGSVHRNRCLRCDAFYTLKQLMRVKEDVPRCACGGTIRPEVVLYEEPLPQDVILRALESISGSDLMIVGGTSLRVYPAAGFVRDYRGKLVIINKSRTDLDARADLVIEGSIAQVLGQAEELLSKEA